MKRANSFEARQKMCRENCEVFHSYNSTPVQVDYHSHDFYEILVFISGTVTYIIEGKAYHLRPGDILLTSNRELHRPIVAPGKPYERFVVWIQESYFRKISSMSREDTDVSACFNCSNQKHYNLLHPDSELLQSVFQILDSLLTLQSDAGYGTDLLKNCLMGELLVYLNRSYLNTTADVGRDVEYNEKISDILYYINQNLCEPLTLDSLAKQFYVSKYHLTREFQTYTGFSLHQYIIKKRLITAKILLQQGYPVKEAFINSGFGDYSHFSRSFQQEYGLSPRAYREAFAHSNS